MKKVGKFLDQILTTLIKILVFQTKLLGRQKWGESSEGGCENGELRYTVASQLPSANIDGVENPIMVMVFHDLTHEYLQVIVMILFTFYSLVFAGVLYGLFLEKLRHHYVK